MKPFLLGTLASLFFAVTFILNRSMELSGGSWVWSASLRYYFMVPFLVVIVMWRGNFGELITDIKTKPFTWVLWSTIGFGLFYAPITFSAAYGPGWLVAGSWQMTIIFGSLLAPLFYETKITDNGPIKSRASIPIRGLSMSFIIVIGVIFMQYEHVTKVSVHEVLLGLLPIMIACIAYPLGNRKMMEACQGQLDVFQRVLGMTLASLPFWFILSGWEFFRNGLPTTGQTFQSLMVAISSGVIATVLFFQATDLVRDDMKKLAAVESTQSVQILFVLIGEISFLNAQLPSGLTLVGMVLVISGVILHSYVSRSKGPVPKLHTVNKNKGIMQHR